MTAEVDHSLESETCRKLISLGYARAKRVRLYGQEMKLMSDPFPQEGGIAVEVENGRGSDSRTVKLPLSVLQTSRLKSPLQNNPPGPTQGFRRLLASNLR